MLVRKERKNFDTMKGHTYMQWLVALLASSTLVTYGLQSGWMSPMTKVLQSSVSPTGPLSDNAISWIASAFCLSAVVGVPLYAYVAETYGRKVGVIAISVPQALCWIVKLFAKSTESLIIARILCGIAAGGCFMTVPIYTKEISQDDIRGSLGALVILGQNIGICAVYALGAYLDYYTVIRVAIGLPVLTILLMLKAPESPAFLVKMGKVDEAATTVAFLRGLDMSDKIVQNELYCMRNEDFQYKSLPDITFTSIFKNKAWRRGFIILLSMMSVQACNGIFAIITYAATILSKSGVGMSPELQSLTVPLVMILGSLVSMYFMEKIGRKPLFTITLSTLGASLAGLASMLLVQDQGGSMPSWLAVVAVALAVFTYSAGVLPTPYVVMTEAFNFQIRGKLMGCLVTYSWFMAFIQVAAFTPLSNALGTYTTFYCFAVICFLGVVVCLVFMPETKGKSIEQIEQSLLEK